MVSQGTIPGTKIGKHWRFSRDAVDRWLHRRFTSRASVLVVDDDPLIGQLFEDVFGDDGYDVVVATEASTAARWVREREFTVVFLDVVMPGLDGAQLLSQIRQARPGQNVILMTAYPDSDLVARALALGPITLLQKPFSIQHLQSTVRALSPG
jgi:DNA-binding NtrC family response regulator